MVTGNTNQITVPNGLKSICNIPLQECKFQSKKHDRMILLRFFIFIKSEYSWKSLLTNAQQWFLLPLCTTVHCYKLLKHSQQGFYKIHKGWFFTGFQTALKSLIFKCFSVHISVLGKKKKAGKQSKLQFCFAFAITLALLIRRMQILDALAKFKQF